MKIQLIQSDIEEAVKDYLSKMLCNIDSKSIEISFCSTRGAEGLIADISLTRKKKIEESPSPNWAYRASEEKVEVKEPTSETDNVSPSPKKTSLFASLNSN